MKVRDASTVAEEQETQTRCRFYTDSPDIVQKMGNKKEKKERKAEHSFTNGFSSQGFIQTLHLREYIC